MSCAIPAPPICSITAPTCAWSRRCSAMRRSRRHRSTPRSARSACGTSTARRTPGPHWFDERAPVRSPRYGIWWLIRHVVTPDPAVRRRRGVGRGVPAGRRTPAVGTAVESGSAPQRRGRSSVRGVPTHATRAEIAGAILHDVGKIECGLGRSDASSRRLSDHGPGRSVPITTTRTSVRRWPGGRLRSGHRRTDRGARAGLRRARRLRSRLSRSLLGKSGREGSGGEEADVGVGGARVAEATSRALSAPTRRSRASSPGSSISSW